MGDGPDGPVIWDVEFAPHLLISGVTGSGKSVAQRTIILHCRQNPMWRVYEFDLKHVELPDSGKYVAAPNAFHDFRDGVEIVSFCKEEMMQRYAQMEYHDVNHFLSLPNPPKAIMLVIDEAYLLMSDENVLTDEGRALDELHRKVTGLIREITQLGRGAGVHVVLSSQRPDADVMKNENLPARYAVGQMSAKASRLVLGTDSATQIPGRSNGQAILSIYGKEQPLQGYFADWSWLDQVTWESKHSVH
jgi:S-DNA-T family DNA segregation ATPase FtsK/SpoIIIE